MPVAHIGSETSNNAELQRLQVQLEQTEQDKESQLSSLKEELLSQTQQLDSCQARVSAHTHTHWVFSSRTADMSW